MAGPKHMAALAWRHVCGHLNDGAITDLSQSCAGCRFEVKYAEDVTAIYRLVEVAAVYRVDEADWLLVIEDDGAQRLIRDDDA